MSIVIFDFETENHDYYGAVSSPHNPENYIVASGWTYVGSIFRHGVYREGPNDPQDPVPFLDDPSVQMLVAHNAAFEIMWLLGRHRERFEAFLKRGGRVFCTALAEYLLSNQQETYPALDEIAPKYGGSHKVDGIKILWEQGHLTSEIDKDLLFEQYLMGPDGDIANTLKVFNGQWELLTERGMQGMMLERCEGLLFNSYAMFNGLHIDREVAAVQSDAIEQNLSKLQASILDFLTGLPEEADFKLTSAFHVAALVYGGPMKYKARVPCTDKDGNPVFLTEKALQFGEHYVPLRYLENQERDKAYLVQEYAKKYGQPVLYKAGKNKGELKEFTIETHEPKTKWGEKLHEFQGVLNLDRYPKEFRDEFKQRYSGARVLANGLPVLSTGADALQDLMQQPATGEVAKVLLQTLLDIAKLEKDLGTYYLKEELNDEGEVVKRSGMLQYLTEHNVVYHTLNCTSTSTTRLSGTRPNMQNIPRGDTSDVKNVFTSRYNDRTWLQWALQTDAITPKLYAYCIAELEAGRQPGVIVEADYSALEVVTLAAFSQDPALCEALQAGTDMHCMRLAKTLGEPYEDVYEKCHNKEHPEHKRYKLLRTHIKPKAFAYQYGATAHGIAYSTGCTVEEAQAFIDAERALFPVVEQWYETEVFSKVQSTKEMHREQFDHGGWRLYNTGYWESPGGTRYEFREWPKTVWEDGQKREVMQFKPTQMRNFPIQGESGFFVQAMSGQVFRWLLHRDQWRSIYIINQVHDALYLDMLKSDLPAIAPAVKYIMEQIPDHVAELGYNLKVPFPVEIEAGPSMNEKEKVV